MLNNESVSDIGAGSWGTALAQQLAGRQYKVKLWGRNNAHIADITKAIAILAIYLALRYQ